MTDDATLFYRQAIGEDPRFAEALLNLGHTLMASGQEDEALLCWRTALSQKPELAETHSEPPAQ